MYCSFDEGRDHFISAAERSGARLFSYPLQGHKGPAGEELATDVATIGCPSAKNVFMLSTHTHGVEGCDELEIAWLDSANEICDKRPDIRFVFAHAINPHGLAYGMRNDHNNVDDNRAFVDFTKLPPTPDCYHQLADAFILKGLSRSDICKMYGKFAAHLCRERFRVNAIEHAVAAGQSDYADGPYFRGREKSWAQKTWENIISCHVNVGAPAQVLHADKHTGLRSYAEMMVMLNRDDDVALKERVRKFANGSLKCGEGAFSAIFMGDIIDFWPSLGLPDNCKITSFTMEFGTSKLKGRFQDVLALRATLLRNALWTLYRDDHPLADQIIRQTREIFSPSDPAWRVSVVKQGRELLHNMVEQATLA